MRENPPNLVLYDGDCGLCDRSVQWLLDHDPEGVLHFAPLEGPTAEALRVAHPAIPSGRSTIVFVERGADAAERVYLRSRAIFRITKRLPGAVRALSVFALLPAFLTDLGYRFVARIRYAVWGKVEQCRVPAPNERARFHP
jgi:predicted DCC family thiol-disulfide oxidoreductase YuxK